MAPPFIGPVLDVHDGIAVVLGFTWTAEDGWSRIELHVPIRATGSSVRRVFCAGPDDLSQVATERCEAHGFRPYTFACADCALGMRHTTALHDAVTDGQLEVGEHALS